MILLTGANGFLGRVIIRILEQECEIKKLSRNTGDYKVSLDKEVPVLPNACLVIHCAGKAHSVPKTESEKQDFFDVNAKGTANLLKGLEQASNLPKSFIFISTVAVYGCEAGIMIHEEQDLNAKDPYGQSKILAEQLVKDWCSKNNVICTILRLPLLVGENPLGNLGAMIKGIKKGYYFNIAGGRAKKSMVLASDVAKLIPIVAEIGGIYNLTDGYHPSFVELSAVMAEKMDKPKPINIPIWIAKMMAIVGDLLGDKAPINTIKLNKIIADLTFDDSKAREMLHWSPKSVLNNLKI